MHLHFTEKSVTEDMIDRGMCICHTFLIQCFNHHIQQTALNKLSVKKKKKRASLKKRGDSLMFIKLNWWVCWPSPWT